MTQLKVTVISRESFVRQRFSVAIGGAIDSVRLNAGGAIFYRACTCHKKQVMNSQDFATKSTRLVGREVGKERANVNTPILVDYLFDTYGKKSEIHPFGYSVQHQ
jgi:hypothetical protein